MNLKLREQRGQTLNRESVENEESSLDLTTSNVDSLDLTQMLSPDTDALASDLYAAVEWIVKQEKK